MSAHAREWMNVMVEFTASSSYDNGYDHEAPTRGERLRRMQANAQQHRQELEAWIAHEGLQGEVKDLGEAMVFDLLFATVTPQAAAALNHAPGVVAVTPAGDIQGPGGVALAYG